MSHADRRYPTRPLAAVDQALGEGRARQPVELLDQLRERLGLLDEHHPSARRVSTDRHESRGQDANPDQGAAADPTTDQAAAPAESVRASRPERTLLRKDRADASDDDQPGDEGASAPTATRQAGQPAVASADGAAGGLADDGQHRVIETGPEAKSEPYRPWFADESGEPWFTEPWFVE